MLWFRDNVDDILDPKRLALDPAIEGTHRRLLALASQRQAGGRLTGVGGYSDRQWMVACGSTLADVARVVEAGLARQEGADLVVLGYDQKGEEILNRKRRGGLTRAAGARSTGGTFARSPGVSQPGVLVGITRSPGAESPPAAPGVVAGVVEPGNQESWCNQESWSESPGVLVPKAEFGTSFRNPDLSLDPPGEREPHSKRGGRPQAVSPEASGKEDGKAAGSTGPAEETRTSPPDSPRSARPPSPHQRIGAYYRKLYEREYDGARAAWKEKQVVRCKQLLADYTPEEIARRLRIYLSPDCPRWMVDGGRDFLAFATHIDKLAAPAPASRSGFDPPPAAASTTMLEVRELRSREKPVAREEAGAGAAMLAAASRRPA